MLIARNEEDARRVRDMIDAEFRAGRVIIDNGWLVEVSEGCTCGGTPMGCMPGCGLEPLIDLVRIEASA